MTEDPWSRLGHDRELPMVGRDLWSRFGLSRDVLGNIRSLPGTAWSRSADDWQSSVVTEECWSRPAIYREFSVRGVPGWGSR